MIKRPALRYHGGKFRLAPWITSFFPEHKIYVEPFGGGASVLLKKERSYAEIYNDIDGDIVNFFKVLRDNGEELKRLIDLTPYSREEFNSSFVNTDDETERARRTIVRSFMGFGSASVTKNGKGNTVEIPTTGFRADSNRVGSIPAHDWKNLPKNIEFLTERLRGVVIENKCALSVINQHESEDTLVYVDPPYVQSSRDSGKDYQFEMTDEEHKNLSDILLSFDGMVIISGYESTLYNNFYANWVKVEKDAYADGAKKRKEILWINGKCYSELTKNRLF
jgi:DNA adenine methylase